MATISDLPAENVLKILEKLEFSADIQQCRFVSRRFNQLVAANSSRLARSQRTVSLSLDENVLHVHSRTSDDKFTVQFDDLSELSARFERLEISTLTIHGRKVSPALSQTADGCSKNYFGQSDDNDSIRVLLEILKRSRQSRIRSLVANRLRVTDGNLCRQLFDMVAQEFCQQIILKDCRFAHAVTPKQIERTENICQYVTKHCEFLDANEALTTDALLRKFSHDLRHGTRHNKIPFSIRCERVTPRAICKFLETWIYMSDAFFFDIRVDGCDASYRDEFAFECDAQRLSHIHFEFPSRAHSTAHVKGKYSQSDRAFQLFPIIDVPARVAGQSVCYARYFRDF